MGLNFQSGHHVDMCGAEEGERVAAALRARFGDAVPLGAPGAYFCLRDEMGWSWWSTLQMFATQRMGEAGSRQIRAVDAWNGLYVDADVDRDVLWPDGRPSRPGPLKFAAPKPSTWLGRVRRAVGLGPRERDIDLEARAALQEMMQQYGPRKGEEHALQVGSLRKLMAEAESLLRELGVEPSASAVEEALAGYSNDDRCDADPAIQCLCHLWLTGTHALAHQQPLWLIK